MMVMSVSDKKTIKLTECSVLLALSIVLSFIKIIPMPMGGAVTLLSMLPVMLVSLKYGFAGGVPCAFVLSLFELFSGIASGNVFVWCTEVRTVIICALFDYLIPFTVLGFAGMFRKAAAKKRETNRRAADALLLAGFVIVIAARFCCHFITGFTIWGQWADGQSPYIYSLIYNGQYMLPECVFTVAGAAVMLKVPVIRRQLSL